MSDGPEAPQRRNGAVVLSVSIGVFAVLFDLIPWYIPVGGILAAYGGLVALVIPRSRGRTIARCLNGLALLPLLLVLLGWLL